MEGRRTRFRGTRSWQPPGFGPNWVVVYCFQVAFHFYHQTPRRARWEAQISLFLVHVPPGQLKKLLPRAQPACALSATAPGLLRSPGSKEKRRKDRHVFGYLLYLGGLYKSSGLHPKVFGAAVDMPTCRPVVVLSSCSHVARRRRRTASCCAGRALFFPCLTRPLL